jgi:hypothetical protein
MLPLMGKTRQARLRRTARYWRENDNINLLLAQMWSLVGRTLKLRAQVDLAQKQSYRCRPVT